jgi:hypothetical protein
MNALFSMHCPPAAVNRAQAGEGKKSLAGLREREGAHPEGMGRVRDCRMWVPSLTLPLLRNGIEPRCGSIPLPQAGEGLIAIGTSAKMCASIGGFAGVRTGPLKINASIRVELSNPEPAPR